MYLKKIILTDIKCFTHFELDFTHEGDYRHWTSILGPNGLGKSTILQAIGVVLAGHFDVMRYLKSDARGWIRAGQPYGMIEAEIVQTTEDATSENPSQRHPVHAVRYMVVGSDIEKMPEEWRKKFIVVNFGFILPWPDDEVTAFGTLFETLYAESTQGWLGCGYGPFRRLSGGAVDLQSIQGKKPSRFITLFREDAALSDVGAWLVDLYNTGRDGDATSSTKLAKVKEAFAQNFFPKPAQLEVNARYALLKVGDSAAVPFEDLSDGYRSMLALGIDLLRWLVEAFPNHPNPMEATAVVLIDELDAHAHPQWQRELGGWLRQKFPNVQFIITTHSPFLAQVADEPGGNVVLEERKNNGVQPLDEQESVEFWRVDQILTELFQLPTTYKPAVEAMLNRHQELYQKKHEQSLTLEETKEYQQLTLWREEFLPPAIEDPALRQLAQTLQKAVNNRKGSLKELQ